ncbi:peptide deformylase [Streptomyces eurythermus]|uniref:peptide deformylase n=1 Tax=Streptomyces eurythermus TaxID=42237 RepID=UPI0036D3282A
MNTLRSTLMAAAGIVQEGDVLLQTVAQPFDLPIRELNAAISRVKELHDFGKGMGIAAPQIGIGRAVAAIVPPGDGSTPVVTPADLPRSPYFPPRP